MFKQGGHPAESPPTTLSKMYLPSNHAPSAPPAVVLEYDDGSAQINHDLMRMKYSSNIGSTAKGIMIGIFSVLGAAGVVLFIAAIVYYFRYTQNGRIFLDRITRPGEYDDEQQFAKEEAEALEEMDDLQRAEYLRAKGMAPGSVHGAVYSFAVYTDMLQPSSRPIRPNPSRPTSRFRSSWPYRRRACQRGSLSLSWK
jgi:hypothetical protein